MIQKGRVLARPHRDEVRSLEAPEADLAPHLGGRVDTRDGDARDLELDLEGVRAAPDVVRDVIDVETAGVARAGDVKARVDGVALDPIVDGDRELDRVPAGRPAHHRPVTVVEPEATSQDGRDEERVLFGHVDARCGLARVERAGGEEHPLAVARHRRAAAVEQDPVREDHVRRLGMEELERARLPVDVAVRHAVGIVVVEHVAVHADSAVNESAFLEDLFPGDRPPVGVIEEQ